jgi:hypothetical protein
VTPASKSGAARQPPYFGRPQGVEALNGKFSQRVSGTAPFKVTVTDARDEEGRPLNVQPCEQVVTDPTRPVVVRLKAGLQVTGRVVDPRGRGVPDVGLSAGEARAQTDAEGRFVLQGLREHDVIVQVSPPEAYVKPKWRRVPAGTRNVEFHLQLGLTIRGRAEDAEGRPVTRGYASARWEASGRRPSGSTGATLGPDGSFTLRGIPEDAIARVHVQQWNTRDREEGLAPTVVEGVRPGTDDLVVRLGVGLTIEGIVVDHRGKPVTDCHVSATSADSGRGPGAWAQVGADGRFALKGLEAGRHRVSVYRQGGGVQPPSQEVDAGASGLRFEFPESASLRGRIEGLDPEVATRWRVQVWDERGNPAGTADVAADGTWRVAAVAAGRAYRIGAQYWRDERYAAAGPLTPGGGEIVLKLRRGLRIEGVVDLSSVELEEGAHVSVVAKSTAWQAPGSVNRETGRFVIQGLPPGRYMVRAWSSSRSFVGRQQNVEAGTENVTIRLGPR